MTVWPGLEDTDVLRSRVAALIARVSDGELTETEILAAGGSLTALGVTSLTFLRLIDAVEEEFGVMFDLDGPTPFMDDLDGLVNHLEEQGVGSGMGSGTGRAGGAGVGSGVGTGPAGGTGVGTGPAGGAGTGPGGGDG
ncbi:acyl carrier protein [Streptomyces sp. AM 4-1-1]|uniref:acyl carrier protein n=1 Tax=Streptomyces sp. AM 4-1-1 TaxID=3028710 RepID=UPI0023B92D4C|nr:acyl carrier protein [Streptomyces sp. AM 4-1-1]WEH34004.1 acyl carrier protein [Streptomyces sp. AM 4-1-1]